MRRFVCSRPSRLSLCLLLGCLWGVPLAGAQTPSEQAQRLLHLLDYVAVDYAQAVQDGTVLDQEEYEEQIEFVQQAQAHLEQLSAQTAQPALLSQMRQLLSFVQEKRPGPDVAALAQQLSRQVIRTYNVVVAPRHAPELSTAAPLYHDHCAGCHGLQGQGDGPAGAKLDPAPRNFHERDSMDKRSLYSLYSTITLGVEGTGMDSFSILSEEERWTLAFYVSTLASPPADLARGAALWQQGVGQAWFPDLASITTATASAIQATYGDEGLQVLTYLRSQPQVVTSSATPPFVRSAQFLRASLAAYRQGQVQAAQDRAVSAYLDGFELAEAHLDMVDATLRKVIEAEMLRYRSMLTSQEAVVTLESQENHLQHLLSQATRVLEANRLPPGPIFLGAFVILLREGLEAVLVLAVILAVLRKSGRRDALPYVHTGWIAALALGGCTWLVASYVITLSGFTREVTAGVTALVAAGTLLYAGLWMHRKTAAEHWRTFLQVQFHAVLSTRMLWMLALVSFLAVYREAFETVLFYQPLWQQVAPAYVPVLGGLVAASGALTILGWLIVRGTVRLPFGLFFGITSLLMVILAVVFVGKGIAALQEAGAVPVYLVSFPELPALGLYPNLLGLLLQAALLVLIAGVFLYPSSPSEEA